MLNIDAIHQPEYYHRDYERDLPSSEAPSLPTRLMHVALPFIGLYAPLSRPLSLLLGASRVYTEISLNSSLLSTTMATAALAATLFMHPMGMLITTAQDLSLDLATLAIEVDRGDYLAACETSLKTMNHALYLSLFMGGGVELTIASLSLQMILGLQNAKTEYLQGHYLESASHLLMSGVRGRQIYGHVAARPMAMGHSDESGALKKTQIEQIRNAKESILVMTFSLSDPDVIGALNAQAEAGLNVTLIVDRNHLQTIQSLKHPNIELLTRSSGEGHFHHKILVIDKTITWLGSANFTAESLGRQLNTMNIIHNKELSSYLYEEIDIVKGLKTRQLTSPPVFNVGGKKVELLLFPHVQNPFIDSVEKQYNAQGKQRILDLLNQAKTHLQFSLCVWTHPDFVQAAIAAKQRGVHVEVVIADAGTSNITIQQLKAAGIPVALNPRHHNKMVVIDDSILINGSANWSKSWLSRNDESFLIVHDLDQAHRQYLKEYWNTLWRNL